MKKPLVAAMLVPAGLALADDIAVKTSDTDRGYRDVTHAETVEFWREHSQRDLTEEERPAVSQMREQVDIMLRGLNSRSRRKTPAPSELAAEAPIETPAEVAALATYAALEGQQQPQPAEPAPQGEVPSPIIVPPPEDAPATQPQELAPPDAATGEPAADLAESAFTPEPPAGDAPEPAPQVQEQAEHSLQPTFQDEPSWDQGPGQAQTIEPQPQLEDVSPQQDSQLVPSSPPPGEQSPSASEPTQADSAAAEATASWETQAEAPEAPEQATAASEPSPQPQGNTEDTWEIGPLEQEEEPAVQHVDPEDALSREVAPEESEDDAPVAATQETPPDEAEAPGEAQTDASDEQEDYPALRRLLREMSGQSEPDESDPPQADQPDEQDRDDPGWRQASRKPAGVK